MRENVRMMRDPGIVFKAGPAGPRAALTAGPDVWEVAKLLREIDERGPEAVAAAAEMLALTEAQVRVAMHYHATHQAEIDAEMTQADAESRSAEAAWLAAQRPPS
jgi:uncharacterized protein YqfA (UPF0365 family)